MQKHPARPMPTSQPTDSKPKVEPDEESDLEALVAKPAPNLTTGQALRNDVAINK